MKRIILIIAIVVLLPQISIAARTISLPFYENFDQYDYQDLIWTSAGATHQWMASGGWRGGAAKFTPCTMPSQGYSGLGQFLGLSGTRINMRMLVYHGSRYREYAPENKMIILVRNSGSRPMAIERDYAGTYTTLGACDGTVCNYGGNDYWPNGNEDFQIGDMREEEWISLEFEANSATGLIKIYIYTQDGELSGLYTQKTMDIGGNFSMVDILGGYFHSDQFNQTDPNNYFMFDELVISNNYIGPPEGFLSGGGSSGGTADTISPTIGLSSPTTGSTYATSGSLVNLAGTASDNVGVTQVSWSILNGSNGVASGTSNWTASNIPLSLGQNLITLQAVDAAGNVASRSLTVNYEDIAGGGGTQPPADIGVIFQSTFEVGNFSEWQGGNTAGLSISSSNPRSGNYCARADLVSGLHGDVGYADYYFGDHYAVGDQKIEEVYLTFWSKFAAGYVWPTVGHKIALLNLTDSSGARQYQVYVFVNGEGEYSIENSDIADWRFYYKPQNIGTPIEVAPDAWVKLKLYARLNTPGQSDGVLKLWVNDQLKADYTNVDIREGTSLGMNKLILSSYANPSSGSNGIQYYDDWVLSTSDPDSSTGTIQSPSGLRVLSN